MKKLLSIVKSKKFYIPVVVTTLVAVAVSAAVATKAEALMIEDETED